MNSGHFGLLSSASRFNGGDTGGPRVIQMTALTVSSRCPLEPAHWPHRRAATVRRPLTNRLSRGHLFPGRKLRCSPLSQGIRRSVDRISHLAWDAWSRPLAGNDGSRAGVSWFSEDMPPRLAAWQAGGSLHASLRTSTLRLFIPCWETAVTLTSISCT